MALAFLYVVVLPWIRPRGSLFWGHYRLLDVYAGIPVVLTTLCVLVVLATPARYRRAVALRAWTLTLVFSVSLLMCDVVYTVAQPRFRQPSYWLDRGAVDRGYSVEDPELGFVRKPFLRWSPPPGERLRAATYRTDENGFRNAPGISKADIVFIGDSFTEAAWIPEESTFVGLVGAQTGLQAVNLGRGLYGPQQELIVLRRYGMAYKPRFVVWQIFEGNDLADAKNFAMWRADPRPPVMSLRERYWENSLIHRLARKTEPRTPPASEIRIQVSYHDGVRQNKRLRYRYVPDQVDQNPQAFADTREVLEAGVRLCESQGIRVAVVFVPTMIQTLESSISFERPSDRETALPGGLVRSDRDFGSRLKAVCREPNCSYIDAFEALRAQAQANNSRVYDREDPDEHLDVDGHAVVGRLVADWIRSKF